MLTMPGVGSRHIDRVELRVGKQGFVACVTARIANTEFRPEGLDAFQVSPAECDELAPVDMRKTVGKGFGNSPRTENAPANTHASKLMDRPPWPHDTRSTSRPQALLHLANVAFTLPSRRVSEYRER